MKKAVLKVQIMCCKYKRKCLHNIATMINRIIDFNNRIIDKLENN